MLICEISSKSFKFFTLYISSSLSSASATSCIFCILSSVLARLFLNSSIFSMFFLILSIWLNFFVFGNMFIAIILLSFLDSMVLRLVLRTLLAYSLNEARGFLFVIVGTMIIAESSVFLLLLQKILLRSLYFGTLKKLLRCFRFDSSSE